MAERNSVFNPLHNFRAAILLGAIALLTGCGSTTLPPAENPLKATAAESSLTFVLSGDTSGFIVPCGCTSKQYGGLPRRATYLQGSTKTSPHQIYLDAGGSIARATDYDAIKLNFIWQGVGQMKPAAMNLGAGEVLLGIERLSELAKQSVPLVSANVAASGATPWKPYIEVSDNGVRIAITGVCCATKAGPGLQVKDAEAALRDLIPELSKKCDAVILLCYGDEQACMKLIGAFPELTAVLAAGTAQPIPPKLIDGRTILASTANKGKFLARAEISGKRNQWKLGNGEIVELSESYADEAGQLQVLAAYKERLKKEKLDPARTGEAPALLRGLPKEYRYAGTAKCTECHALDAVIHANSKHAHGLQTLTSKGFDFDPYCLKCHTTGYGGPGGYSSLDATPQLGGIGCESCHGPSQAHALDSKVKTPVPGKTACITCHDPENSPSFNFEQFWPRIKHGAKVSQ